MSFPDNETAQTISFWIKKYLPSHIPSRAADEETVRQAAVLIRRRSLQDNFSFFFFSSPFFFYAL